MSAPNTAPTVGISASPVHNLCVNVEWWAHISGRIAELSERDVWEGTDSQITDAISAICQLLNVGLPTTDCGGTMSYPQHAMLWHYQSRIMVGGGMTNISLADSPNNIHGP